MPTQQIHLGKALERLVGVHDRQAQRIGDVLLRDRDDRALGAESAD